MRARVIYFVAIFSSALFALSACSVKGSEAESLEAEQEVDQDSIDYVKAMAHFDSLETVNQKNLLFLSFWEGMGEGQYDWAVAKLLREGKIVMDTLPPGTREDWASPASGILCAAWVLKPYYSFRDEKFDVRATLFPLYDSLSGKIISIRLDLVHDYNGKYDFRDFPYNLFCSVPNAYSDALVELYSSKYGRPNSRTYNDAYALGYYREYRWTGVDKLILMHKTISNTDLDHKKKQILEYCHIEYWHPATFAQMQQRERESEREQMQRIQQKKRKTKNDI